MYRISLHILAFGALLAVVVGFVSGAHGAIACALGALIAAANWLSLSWIVARGLAGHSRAGLSALLFIKMGALVGLCWVLIAYVQLDVVGLSVGLSALVLGLASGAGAVMRSADSPAEEH